MANEKQIKFKNMHLIKRYELYSVHILHCVTFRRQHKTVFVIPINRSFFMSTQVKYSFLIRDTPYNYINLNDLTISLFDIMTCKTRNGINMS